MSTEEDTTPGIIVPGPELRAKIEKSAASLAKRDKRKAEEMMAKVLASQKREEFLFFEITHVFYPFFLQKLNEYRAHPELIPTEEKKDASDKAVTSTSAETAAAATTTTTTVKADGVVRREGGTAARHDPKRDEALRQAEVEAQRYLEDPFPNRYSLDLLHGTIDMPALALSYMTCAAQYVAKYGEQFLQNLLGRYRSNAAFRFLNAEDVRYEVFMKLVESYRLILHHDPDEVEDRLERCQSARSVLDTVCEEKVKYARAAIARRKAALLTDEALRDKLEWNVFTVVQQFSLSDLGLDGPMPQSAAARRRAHLDSSHDASTSPAINGNVNDNNHIESTVATMDMYTNSNTNDINTTTTTTTTTSSSSSGVGGPPRMLRPPEGVAGPPTFTPVFMSSHLVTSTDPTAAPSRSREGYGGVGGGHSARGGAARTRGTDHFGGPRGGQHARADGLGQQGDDTAFAGDKHSRAEADEPDRNIRHRREEADAENRR